MKYQNWREWNNRKIREKFQKDLNKNKSGNKKPDKNNEK
jgi:hypothetical protein